MATPAHEKTAVWKETLAHQADDEHEQARAQLRVAYGDIRERAAHLADHIKHDLPDFTIHDVSHLDRLWELVDLVRGSHLDLNPAEAFVLGAAILLHDLGMASTAYPGGLDEVRQGDDYEDALSSVLRGELGRAPTSDELRSAGPEAVKTATAQVLRERHAGYAERLAEISWDDGGQRHYLIEKLEIRRSYGEVAGKIASSHGAPVSDLPRLVGNQRGAAPGSPTEWTVEPLKLACLLRIADACHVDATRAPTFLAALRRPQGIAREHWTFQGKLNQPHRDGDRLVFTSREPFDEDDATSWWQAHEWLTMVSAELRDVDSLLADLGQPRLSVAAVAGAEDPQRLAQHVATPGWRPVDARLHVTDMSSLVSSLGGEALYGPKLDVPLRELLQNAADAVTARRRVDRRDSAWGSVRVALRQHEDGSWWLAVADTGVGMAEHVLSGPLLDFSQSFWVSEAGRREFPGLLGSGFESVGRFGIGFFSVFMLGGQVRVISRRYDAAQEATRVLEFTEGPARRPLLREAHPEERLQDGGTRVEVRLDVDPYSERGLFGDAIRQEEGEREGTGDLASLLGYLAPAYPVDLYSSEADQEAQQVLEAHDWLTIDSRELIERITAGGLQRREEIDEAPTDPELEWIESEFPTPASLGTGAAMQAMEQNLRVIKDAQGRPVGRACIVPDSFIMGDPSRSDHPGYPGVVTIGGLRAGAPDGFAGILEADPLRAARDRASLKAPLDSLADWATEQADLVGGLTGDPQVLKTAADHVRWFGGTGPRLPVAYHEQGWLSPEGIANLAHGHDKVVLLTEFDIEGTQSFADRGIHADQPLVLADNVIVAGDDPLEDEIVQPWPPAQKSVHQGILAGSFRAAVVEALAQGWGCDPADVQLREERAVWGSTSAGDLREVALVVARP